MNPSLNRLNRETAFSPQLVLSETEFAEIKSLVYRTFGINLTDKKHGLVTARLQGLVREQGLESYAEYCALLRADKTGQHLTELVNRISTNYTYFFREPEHFDFMLKTALPGILKTINLKKNNDLRLWSAGCSTGEEPYSLTVLLMEFLGADYHRWDAGVLATDVSARALGLARAGIYSKEHIRRLPASIVSKYFVPTGPGQWSVAERIKREVTFRSFNLMTEKFPFKKPFHIIFCRNVMIYFDQATRNALINRFYEVTAPGGYLFIGHSETLDRSKTPYRFVQPAIYQRI